MFLDNHRTDSLENAWTDIRDVYGPRVAWSTVSGTISYNDVADWSVWAVANGKSINDASFFGKWLIWKLNTGTDNYGNLPTRIRDHTGISCIPCPYDSNSDALHTRVWLGLDSTDPLPTRVDHGSYYMKVTSRGSKWGFECTCPTCVYFLDNGIKYVHI